MNGLPPVTGFLLMVLLLSLGAGLLGGRIAAGVVLVLLGLAIALSRLYPGGKGGA